MLATELPRGPFQMKRPAVLLAVVLLLLSAAFITYRIVWLRYPLFPPGPKKAWVLDMEARLRSDRGETTVMIAFPGGDEKQIIAEERIYSGALSFNLLREGPNQVGVWSGMVDPGGETIGYRATILMTPPPSARPKPPTLGPYPAYVGEEDRTLARRLVGTWDRVPPPARLQAVAATATDVWAKPMPNSQDLKAWAALRRKIGRREGLLLLLRAANLPARSAEGLRLSESVTTEPVSWIEVWTGKEWEKLHPETGEIYPKSISFLPLVTGGLPSVRISGGRISETRWTLSQQIISQWRLHFERIKRSSGLLDRWSLFRLPPEFQATFRILLLVPIGALMICLLRNIVGFPTFGIFMPVLMALAFRNTGLLYGLGIFSGVILLGYGVRRSIDRLRLLLVPRLSVILTLVIVSFTILAVIGNKFGLREVMAVGLLPFVILTMTIERFFILTEEAGIDEALRTAAGSAAVAAITYVILHLEPLQLTFFVYPELLLAVAALQVFVGRYTGYRLSEFIRFRKFRNPT